MGEGPATVRARYAKARRYAAIAAATVASACLAVGATVAGANAAPGTVSQTQTSAASSRTYTSGTATPIKHLVVIFQENVSFDHYFGTYPYAANTDGSPFNAKRGTPTVNGLYSKITKSGPVGPLLTNNPNLYNPTRLTPSEALTCDQDHDYTPEQQAVNGGKMDKFVQYTESPAAAPRARNPFVTAGPGDGLLRRQHGHRPVELRAELRDERQQLRHPVRAVYAGRTQPRLGQHRLQLCRQPDRHQ